MQTIIAGGGAQEVEAYARDALGRIVKPTSATAVIVDLCEPDTADDAVRIVLASGPAIVDATTTTTTAASGPRELDARRVTVASAAGFVVGRLYGLVGGGSTEAFELERIDGLDLYARDKLRARFEIGAGVEGLRVSVVFPALRADDAAELARETDFGADWTFVGTTGPTPVRTVARIERRAVALLATTQDLLLLDPQLGEATHSTTLLESHLRRADLEVGARLQMQGRSMSDRDEGGLAKIAVTYAALELAYRVLPEAHEDRAIWAGRMAAKWLRLLLGGRKSDDVVVVARTTDARRGRRLPGAAA